MNIGINMMDSNVLDEHASVIVATGAWQAKYTLAEAVVILCRFLEPLLPQVLPKVDDAARQKIIAFATAMRDAEAAGNEFIAANELKRRTVAYEIAVDRLARDVVPDDDVDAAERVAAQAVVDGAEQDVLDLYALRHPQEVGNAQGT